MTTRPKSATAGRVVPERQSEWRVEIPGFLPTSLNRLIGNRYRAARLKKTDAKAIAKACLLARVPPVALSTGEKKARKALEIVGRMGGDPEPAKRHVSLEIKLGKGERASDPDNLWKGLLDGLKHAGMLFDDSRFWCSHDAEIKFSRGENKWDRGTVIILREDQP